MWQSPVLLPIPEKYKRVATQEDFDKFRDSLLSQPFLVILGEKEEAVNLL